MPAKDIIVGTAGHIDHGKSTLVRALTGTDPDRLAEEKRRGITIDLGFAHFAAGEAARIGFVDVPGHHRFVRNMLAGAGGIDAVLLVVAANESVMPQTREHFEICRLLGVRHGVIAITKVDLVEPDLLAIVELEIQDLVKGSCLEGAPTIPVSTVTGSGLERLKTELASLVHAVPARSTSSGFRLPIDRVFSIRGFGTVVTGSLLAGTVYRDQDVTVQPLGRAVRIRGIQVYGSDREGATAGQRVAVNLQNVKASDLQRGMELTVAHTFEPVTQVLASIEMLPSAPASLKSRTRVRVHHGTGEARAVAHLVGVTEIVPGGNGYVRLVFDHPILALLDDRFIIRRFSPANTLGGAIVLDIQQSVGKHKNAGLPSYLAEVASGDLTRLTIAIAARRASAGIDETTLLGMTNRAAHEISGILRKLIDQQSLVLISKKPLCAMDSGAFSDLCGSVVQAVKDFHHRDPVAAGMSKEELFSTCLRGTPAGDAALNALVAAGRITVDHDMVNVPGAENWLSSADACLKREIESVFLAAGLTVPYVSALLDSMAVPKDRAKRIVFMLTREGSLIKVSDDLVFHAAMLNQVKDKLSTYKQTTHTIDVASFKNLLNITRKHAIPILEYCDREHITRRVGEQRWIE